MMIIVSAACVGAASIPILPVSLSVTAEVTYPIQEEASTGMLILGGNLAGVVFSYGFAFLLKKTPTFQGVCTPAAIVTAMFRNNSKW